MPPQPPGWGHLVSVRAGVAELRCEGVRAFVTPNAAVWVPNGMAYALDLRMPTRLRILYADAARHPHRPFGPVEMTPLLRELVERAVTSGFLDPRDARDEHVLSVIGDELANLRNGSDASVLVIPRDPMLRALVDVRTLHVEPMPTVATLAGMAGLSIRAFERRFGAETGLTPREWFRRIRLAAGLVALASGESVTEAGLACGYASTSAFISAFRALYGMTPGGYRTYVYSSHLLPTLLE